MTLETCLAYLEKLPHANSGSGGHNATLQAALACRRFGLDSADTWSAMQWFNDNRCTPRWSEKELRHKVDSVANISILKPLGKAISRAAKVFKPLPARERATDTRPVIERSAQEEELWWAKVAQARGATVEAWDDVQPSE